MQIDTELIVIWIRFYLKSVKKFGLLISNIKMDSRSCSNIQSFQVKVVLLGDSGVGKTSIVSRFALNSFEENRASTIGASFLTKNVEFFNKIYRFQLWDTAGQERYRALAKTYYQDSHCAILVYDITNMDSFEELKRWVVELKSNGPLDCPIVIVANK